MRLVNIYELPDAETCYVARDKSMYSIGVKIPSIRYASFTEVMTREIDTRPCDLFAAADTDWGEQDSLANIPRRTVPTWLRALSHVDRGDE